MIKAEIKDQQTEKSGKDTQKIIFQLAYPVGFPFIIYCKDVLQGL